MFGIFPEDKPVNIEGESVLPASIIIDAFSEMMNIPLFYWGVDDYKNSWIRSLEEGLENKKHATLAVSMYEPKNANFIFTWVLYFYDEQVFIQNKLLFLDELPGFSIDRINDFIEPRITHNEDGMKISEWSTDLNSVLDFYHRLKIKPNLEQLS